jgi:DNA-binding SARP family transcriptional activator
VPSLTSRKAQELFCYLLLYRDHPHPRETLAGLLWGDTSTTQSKTYLRKALWQLQTILEPHDACAQQHVLLLHHDWVQINPSADFWLDVAAFEQVCNGVQGVPGEQLDYGTASALREAVALYQGELLDGWYQDWCLYERERLQTAYLALLDKLMGYCEVHQEFDSGLVYGAQILRYDRAREHTHRRMMRLHTLAGDRTAALRQFKRCADALEEELGVKPTARTVQLYEQILHNQLTGDALTSNHPPASSEAPSSLIDILGCLNHLKSTMTAFQQRIQQDIQAVEQALKSWRAG